MRVFLNAGFGEPLGSANLASINGLQFKGVRQDVYTVESVARLVGEFEASPLAPLFVVDYAGYTAEIAQEIVRVASHMLHDYAVEIGNELNIPYPTRGPVDPKVYSHAFAEIEAACRRIDSYAKVITAGINTTDAKGMEWLEQAVRYAGGTAIIGFHSYRQDQYPDPEAPQKGYRSREAEFVDLKRAAGPRRIWNTEIGWHTAPRTKGFWPFRRSFRLTDTEVANYLTREISINKRYGVEVVNVYQLNDGPNPNYSQDTYGIRRLDMTWKPSAHVAEGVS